MATSEPELQVGLDATPLSISTGGIRRYTEELSQALARNFPEDRYTLLSDQPFRWETDLPGNLDLGQRPTGVLHRRWWSWGVQREMSRRGIGLFHGTDFAVPYLPLRPSVMTVHDLSPWRNAEWHHAAGRVRRRTPYLLGLSLATMVVTPSEAVRRELIEHFRVHSSRVAAVPHAAGKRFQPVCAESPDTPYFLFLGTLEPRKNLDLLVRVWRGLRHNHPVDLVLAGRRREDFHLPESAPGMRMPGEVPEEKLPALYANAVACLYPSFYEGFGLPVLEAMQCGAVVIASRDPAVAEVAGDAAVLLDPRDDKAWHEAMLAALTQPQWLAPLREKARRRAAGFSWDRTARLTREVYAEAKRRFES